MDRVWRDNLAGAHCAAQEGDEYAVLAAQLLRRGRPDI